MTTPPVFDWDQIPPTITNHPGTETYYTNLDQSRPMCRIHNDGTRVMPNRSDLICEPNTCKLIVLGYRVTYHVTPMGYRKPLRKPYRITDRRNWFAAEVPE